jgi:hypothetical protein
MTELEGMMNETLEEHGEPDNGPMHSIRDSLLDMAKKVHESQLKNLREGVAERRDQVKN